MIEYLNKGKQRTKIYNKPTPSMRSKRVNVMIWSAVSVKRVNGINLMYKLNPKIQDVT